MDADGRRIVGASDRSPLPSRLPIIGLAALLCVIAWERAEGQLTTTEYLPYSQAQSRFLNREYYPWWHERYENYSLLSYRDYTARPENPTYDPFGAYLLDGVELLRVEEYRTLSPPAQQPNFSQRPSSGHLSQLGHHARSLPRLVGPGHGRRRP